MQTRTSANWEKLPGYFDRHNLFDIYESSNEYGIPDLEYQENELPDNLVPYNIRVRSQLGYTGLGIHFYLDDYRFEQCWVKPEVGLERVRAAQVALTPDFSLFMDMPKAVQIYNTYRNRWVGKFWQEREIKIIPTLSWSDEDSYKFCFLGIPKGMNVSVSTVSVNKDTKDVFLSGFAEAIRVIQPNKVACYGKPLPEMLELHDYIKPYRPNFEGLRALRNNKNQTVEENKIYSA